VAISPFIVAGRVDERLLETVELLQCTIKYFVGAWCVSALDITKVHSKRGLEPVGARDQPAESVVVARQCIWRVAESHEAEVLGLRLRRRQYCSEQYGQQRHSHRHIVQSRHEVDVQMDAHTLFSTNPRAFDDFIPLVDFTGEITLEFGGPGAENFEALRRKPLP